jgi:hypothetical protein
LGNLASRNITVWNFEQKELLDQLDVVLAECREVYEDCMWGVIGGPEVMERFKPGNAGSGGAGGVMGGFDSLQRYIKERLRCVEEMMYDMTGLDSVLSSKRTSMRAPEPPAPPKLSAKHLYLALVKIQDTHTRKTKPTMVKSSNTIHPAVSSSSTELFKTDLPSSSSPTSQASRPSSMSPIPDLPPPSATSTSSPPPHTDTLTITVNTNSTSLSNPSQLPTPSTSLSSLSSSSSRDKGDLLAGYAIAVYHPNTRNVTVLDVVLRVPGSRQGGTEAQVIREVVGRVKRDVEMREKEVRETVKDERDDLESGVGSGRKRKVRDEGDDGGGDFHEIEMGRVQMVMEKGLPRWRTQLLKLGIDEKEIRVPQFSSQSYPVTMHNQASGCESIIYGGTIETKDPEEVHDDDKDTSDFRSLEPQLQTLLCQRHEGLLMSMMMDDFIKAVDTPHPGKRRRVVKKK